MVAKTPTKRGRGRPSLGPDSVRTPVNLTTTYGLARLLEKVQEKKHDRDVRDDHTPKTTRSVFLRVAMTKILDEDPDTAKVLREVRRAAKSEDPEEREEAELILRHWQMAKDEAEAYDQRHG